MEAFEGLMSPGFKSRNSLGAPEGVAQGWEGRHEWVKP